MDVWNNLTKTLLGQEDQNVIIKVDPVWGFAEFPAPGDTKKHLLPVLVDEEELQANAGEEVATDGKASGRANKEFWMPDRFCKVCYGCEEPFTMYRRRHHCRMCGQIFCNNCSSYSIDGALFNTPGLVRSCKDCFEQSSINDAKAARRKLVSEKTQNEVQLAQHLRDLNAEYRSHNEGLQQMASKHLSAIIEKLVDGNAALENHAVWKETILSLIKSVVSTVDPDVRNGDSLDIRPYIKIKVIPGGLMSECTYIDGVVFRKNVSHKKMAGDGAKINPKILLLAGGIEFQRAEIKLSSMDTLIEQEDKYMEILVEKIMSLKPDIILVGKAVARRAQELLCEHNVVVMQNVKLSVLERVARMTGAMLLPSTDNMIQQFGDDCLGSCGSFCMRLVQDDPERSSAALPQRILRTRISRASTYAYFQGCPTERGCSIVLRGAERTILAEIKRIIRFSISVAYHLRLEVAYYQDRFADIVSDPWTMEDAGSDVDDEIVDERTDLEDLRELNPVVQQLVDHHPAVKNPLERRLLSTSLDIDFNVPYRRELIGTSLFRSKNLTKCSLEGHQTLLITSLVMGEANAQKSGADVKGIKYYTKHDIALGHFILENCFQLSRGANKDSKMLDQTLSFVHRPGRIDITVRKIDRVTSALDDPAPTAAAAAAASNNNGSNSAARDSTRAELSISSYCKECGRVVAPPHKMSEEVYKLSFGKFLEMTFYNRSAVCAVNNCFHSLRDDHILSFSCDNYIASFEFTPIHPYALHIRAQMPFPEEFYWQHSLSILAKLPESHAVLMEDFKLSMVVLEREVRDLLSSRPDDMALALADVQMMESELRASSIAFLEDLLCTYQHLPRRHADKEMEGLIVALIERYTQNFFKADKTLLLPTISEADENAHTGEMSVSESFADAQTTAGQSELGQIVPFLSPQDVQRAEFSPTVAAQFPMVHFRDTYLRACRWNTRIDTVYKFLESVRNLLLQQINSSAQTAANPSMVPAAATASLTEQLDAEYQALKQRLAEGLLADITRTGRAEIVQQALAANLASLSVSNNSNGTNNNGGNSGEREKNSLTARDEDLSTGDSNSLSLASSPPGTGIVGITETTSLAPAALTSLNATLYKTSLEQSSKRQSDRPTDKMSRITKALSRFLVLGNKDTTDNEQKFFVPLNEFGNGRYGLKPGRGGVVIPVHEEVCASIIAYALASNEYFRDLQNSIKQLAADEQEATIENELVANKYANKRVYDETQASDDKAADDFNGQDFEKKSVAENDDDEDEDKEEEEEETHTAAAAAAATAVRETAVTGKNSNYGLTNLMKTFSSNDDANSRKNDAEQQPMFGSSGKKESLFGRGNANKAMTTSVSAEDAQQRDTQAMDSGFSSAVGLHGNDNENEGDGSESMTSKKKKKSDTGVTASAETETETSREANIGLDYDDGMSANEKQMVSQDKSNIRIRFNDYDDRGNLLCKFHCQVYYAKQFEAVRTCYFNEEDSIDNFVRALAMTARWNTQGGKSGASFAKTMDERLVIKAISKVELQMYLDFAPAYFEYMAKAYYHNLPTVLCKILGVYTVRFDNKETGKKSTENIVVMENIFYQRNITKTFDLKGSSRARYAELHGEKLDRFDETTNIRRRARRRLQRVKTKIDLSQKKPNSEEGNQGRDSAASEGDKDDMQSLGEGRETLRRSANNDLDPELLASLQRPRRIGQVLLDDNLMEFTQGRPFPLKHRAKLFFHKAVQNDTLFLSIVNVVDYSILIGVDENSHELVVGIIDYLRQYDIIKRVERLGKGSVGMLTGQADPTIIQPSQYRKRFTLAMERYFMTVPDHWIHYDA